MLNTAFFAAVGACVLAATAAATAPGEKMVIGRVEFADLDLGSTAGRTKLKSRIHRAATRICSDYELPAPTGLSVNHRCFQAAMKDALRQMDQAIAQQGSKRIAVSTIPLDH